MLSLKKSRDRKIKILPLKSTLLLILLTLIFSTTTFSQQNHPCEKDSINLRGDLNIVMNRGGLWALMEQTEGLQDKSLLGFQVDGKLARAVGQFETMCEEGEKKPTKQFFDNLTSLLGNARTTWNPRSSGEAIVKSLNDLNKKLDALLLIIK